MSEATESGTRPQRLEFVRETTIGETPANPVWEVYSDNFVNAPQWEPDNSTTGRRGAGSPDVQSFFSGPEDHAPTVSYDMQRWFVDGTGSALDAAGDAILRASDNSVNNTHSIVKRETHATGGAAGAGRRIYVVGRGMYPTGVTIPLEVADDAPPVELELSYQGKKVRSYVIDQPSATTDVVVVSTSANDTTQSVTIEDESAATTETVTLSGTSVVQTTATFADIDAISLDAETEGDVEVYTNGGDDTTPAKGTLLATIKGSNAYDDVEGDLGVPALGTGSHASAIGTDYVRYLVGDLSFASGSIASRVHSGEIAIESDVTTDTVQGTLQKVIDLGNRTSTATVTVGGPKESHKQTMAYLQRVGDDIDWTDTNGTLTLPSARRTGGVGETKESENAARTLDVAFEGEGVTVS